MEKPAIRASFDEPTNTVSYLVRDPATKDAAVTDPVLDWDNRSGEADGVRYLRIPLKAKSGAAALGLWARPAGAVRLIYPHCGASSHADGPSGQWPALRPLPRRRAAPDHETRGGTRAGHAPFHHPPLRRTAVTLYERWLLPRLIAWAMRAEDLAPYRRRLVPRARGRVLEVGVGSGLNLLLYGPAAERVIGLDPSAELLRRAATPAVRAARPVHLIRAAAEAIPLPEASMDTVVMTWTLCSLRDARAGLQEMRRVLRPGGELLFVEHGLAPEPGVAAWQHRLDPLWHRISCHLDNPVERLVSEAGLRIAECRSGYLGRGPKPMTFMTEGVARA